MDIKIVPLSDGVAGRSKDGKTVYIDPLVPKESQAAYVVHEMEEHKQMLNGIPYGEAHILGDKAEKRYVISHGGNWKDHQRVYHEVLAKIEASDPKPKNPSDLFEGSEGEKEIEKDIDISDIHIPHMIGGVSGANRQTKDGGDDTPYPNYHSLRVKDPGSFQEGSFRNKALPNGIQLILAKPKGSTNMATQAVRFPKDKFTPAEAKAWAKDNDLSGSFEAAKEDDAKKSDSSLVAGFLDDEADGLEEYSDALGKIDDPALKKIITGIRNEEKQHNAKLETWLKENDPDALDEYEGSESPDDEDEEGDETTEKSIKKCIGAHCECVTFESLEKDASKEHYQAFHDNVMADPQIPKEIKDRHKKKAMGPAVSAGKKRANDSKKKPDPDDNDTEEDAMDAGGDCIEDSAPDIKKSYLVDIAKEDDGVVYGVVLHANKKDLQGDFMKPTTIRKACHQFMREYRNINTDHKNDSKAFPVENWLAKEAGILGTSRYGPGDWLAGVDLNPDPQVLKDYRAGKYKSFSIEGTGRRRAM